MNSLCTPLIEHIYPSNTSRSFIEFREAFRLFLSFISHSCCVIDNKACCYVCGKLSSGLIFTNLYLDSEPFENYTSYNTCIRHLHEVHAMNIRDWFLNCSVDYDGVRTRVRPTNALFYNLCVQSNTWLLHVFGQLCHHIFGSRKNMFVHKELQRGSIQFLTILKTNNIITVVPTLYYIYVYNFNQNLKNCALLLQKHMFYCDMFYCCRRSRNVGVGSLKMAR